MLSISSLNYSRNYSFLELPYLASPLSNLVCATRSWSIDFIDEKSPILCSLPLDPNTISAFEFVFFINLNLPAGPNFWAKLSFFLGLRLRFWVVNFLFNYGFFLTPASPTLEGEFLLLTKFSRSAYYRLIMASFIFRWFSRYFSS